MPRLCSGEVIHEKSSTPSRMNLNEIFKTQFIPHRKHDASQKSAYHVGCDAV
jgi:hypothetical protein